MRRQIVIMTVLVAVLSMALFALPLALGLPYYYRSQQRDDVQRVAAGVAAAASDNLASGKGLQSFRHSGDFRVGLYDANGTLVSGRTRGDAAGLVAQALRGDDAHATVDGRFAVAVPVREGNAVAGAVVVVAGTHELRQLVLITVALIVLACLALAITRIVAGRRAARLAQPLEQLSEDAARLGDASFTPPTRGYGIAEIDDLARAMTTASARLSELIERERALATEASHQLRTPLTSLGLTLEAAREADDPREAIRDALAIVERLELTVSDMLRLVMRPQSSPALDVEQLFRDVAARWHIVNHDPTRELRLERDKNAPVGAMSLGAARQILDVLIDNAAQHGEGSVTVTARDAGGALAIDVSQDGPVLNRQVQDLFAGTGSGSGGTGLGLPLARAIARSEGARLILGSADPVTFIVVIPGRAGDDDPSAERDPQVSTGV